MMFCRTLSLGSRCLLAAAVSAALSGAPAAYANTAVASGALHPWVVPAPKLSPEAYFTNLQDGSRVESPFVAKFGLARRGLVPAGKTVGTNGHHHLLIDTNLPVALASSLPFSPTYIHFGKGQMETVMDLPPGTHRMRLLLADYNHVPFFVYSKEVQITVTRRNEGVAPATVTGPPGVSLLNLTDGGLVMAPFRVQFHASGFNISHIEAQVAATHHFRLKVERNGQRPEVLTFQDGSTETWLAPPPGSYAATLELVDNTTGKVVSTSRTVRFAVKA